jgi:hypothetical protein
MYRTEKILACVAVVGLLFVYSNIFIINQNPPFKPQKGLTAWTALSISRVDDIAKGWNPDAAISYLSTGTTYKANITKTGKSNEWDFTYCYPTQYIPLLCKEYRVNADGVLFHESAIIEHSYKPGLNVWKVDSDQAIKILFQSKYLKSEYNDLKKIKIDSMELESGYYLDDNPTWVIKIIQDPWEYPHLFLINAYTGELYY